MCVVSMIGDHYRDKWKEIPWIKPNPFIPFPSDPPEDYPYVPHPPKPNGPTQKEFDELKKEVEEMKKLLERAKKYDEDNNEPNCEMEEKLALLRKVAELVGVDLSEIFEDKSKTKPKTKKKIGVK